MPVDPNALHILSWALSFSSGSCKTATSNSLELAYPTESAVTFTEHTKLRQGYNVCDPNPVLTSSLPETAPTDG